MSWQTEQNKYQLSWLATGVLSLA